VPAVIRAVDDLATPTRGVATGRRTARVLGLLLAALALVIASLGMERRVARSLAETEGRWRFDGSTLPEWFPVGFTGSLAEIARLPESLPLRSATWRERLAATLERNPWIERVDEVSRSDEGIEFTARFLRPVVAVRSADGYLLFDSAGRAIDLQPGRELDPVWGVPECILEERELPALGPGELLEDPTFVECLSLVRVLWESRTLERHPGEIPALDAYTDGEAPGLLWRLHTRSGVALYWGRAPASEQVSARPVEEKVATLEEVLRLGDRIRGAGGISLHGPEPLVVGRR
jgi:hypothetical protein